MKKIITCLSLVLLLCFLPVCTVSASDEKAETSKVTAVWTLGKDAEYITDGKYVYYPLDFERGIPFDKSDSYSLNSYEDKYRGSRVYTDGNNVIVRAEISTDHSWYDAYYVEESHLDEFNKLKDGQSETYYAYNLYETYESITQIEYILWQGGDQYHMSARRLEEYESFPIYAVDSTGSYRYESGLIFRNWSDETEMFLLVYAEYDRSYFYRGGEFATDHDGEITLYKLSDKQLIGQLNTTFDTLPDDDLDWIVKEDTDNTFVAVFATVFFALIPFGIGVIGTVLLIKIKDKKYRRPLIAVICGSVAVITAYAVIFALILTHTA